MRNVEIADALAKIAVNDVNKKTVSIKCLEYSNAFEVDKIISR